MQTTHDSRGVPLVSVAARFLLFLVLALSSIAALLVAAERSRASQAGARIFGVVHQGNFESLDLQRLAESNAASLRFLLAWGQVQGSFGPCLPNDAQDDACDWSEIDRYVGGAAAAGADPLPFMYGSIAGDPFAPPLGSPDQIAAWQQFLRSAVQRYGPNGYYWANVYPSQYPGGAPMPIRVWQIWNEPGSPAYFRPKPSPQSYFQLLQVSRQALRSVDGGAKLMLAGLFSSTERGAIRGRLPALDYLRRLYRIKGSKKAFDIVALHPYSRTVSGTLAQVKGIRQIMQRAGDGRTKLAVTELGWSSNRPNGSLLAKGVKGQARMLRGTFKRLLDQRRQLRLADVSWFSLRDIDPNGPGSCPNCPWSGLVQLNGTPKPAWNAFLSFTH
jgi:hypothetical protein